MMTRDQFQALQGGDVVRISRPDRSWYDRTVLPDTSLNAHLSKHFPIRRRSWTGRIYTVIGSSEMLPLMAMRKLRHTEMLMTEAELLRLHDGGIRNIRAAFEREVTDQCGLWHNADNGLLAKIQATIVLAERWIKERKDV